jgi:uncharacterized membrane protein
MRISASERVMAFLGYLPFPLFLIPIKMRRDSMFVQFHSRQGAVLFCLWAALAVVLTLALLFAGAGMLATILIGILFVLTFVWIVMALIGILKVLLGERYRMPVVADVALLLRL